MPEIVKLNSQELVCLTQCEDTIRDGLEATASVIEALKEIKESRLYRQDYRSFNDYCAQKWGFGANYAGKLMRAQEVMDVVPVKNERQARVIQGLDTEDRLAVWDEACDKAGGPNKVTARILHQATRDFRNRRPEYNGPDPEPLEEMLSLLRTTRNRLEEMVNEEVGAFIGIEVTRDLQQIINYLSECLPTGYCEKCKGKGCDWCGGHGWLSRAARKRYRKHLEDSHE